MTDKEKKEIGKEIVTNLDEVIDLILKLMKTQHGERTMGAGWHLQFIEALNSADSMRASFINGLQLSDD